MKMKFQQMLRADEEHSGLRLILFDCIVWSLFSKSLEIKILCYFRTNLSFSSVNRERLTTLKTHTYYRVCVCERHHAL